MTEDKEMMIAVKEMIKLLRIQNHDILNGLQVVSGYLQLGNIEQAQIYLKKTIKNWSYQRELFRWDYLSTILLLMRLKVEVAEVGIKFIINGSTNLKNLAVSEENLNEFLIRMMDLFRKNVAQEERELVLKVEEKEEHYSFEFAPCFTNGDEEFCKDMKKQAYEITNKVGSACDLIDNCLVCQLPKKPIWMVAE